MEQNDSPHTPPPASGSLPTNADNSAAAPPVVLDAHGFDPDDYDWVPVRRKRRPDGWSPERQRRFIQELADSGSVVFATNVVGMSERSAYALRRAPGAEGFAAAWDAAIGQASKKLVDLAFERAVNGSDEPVYDKEGRVVGRRMKTNDRLLMFLLRSYMPERFRFAHRDTMAPGETLLPAAQPISEAMKLLDPVPPAEPHKLMPPEELDIALQVAENLPEGQLPHWRREPELVRMEHEKRAIAEGRDPYASPLGPEFEEMLDHAKRAANGDPTSIFYEEPEEYEYDFEEDDEEE